MPRQRKPISALILVTFALAACDGDPNPLAEAIAQYCATAIECDEDDGYCRLAIECDRFQNCNISIICDEDWAKDECEARQAQLIEEQGSERCVPLWTSFFECEATLSCVDFGTSAGYEICAEEATEELIEELFDDCGVPW